MCGRFAQAIPLGKLKKIELFTEIFDQLPMNYNVAPGEFSGIIIKNEAYTILRSKWGLVNKNIKTDFKPKPFINAKSETVAERKYFRDAFNNSRCIIPANGFFEWKKTGKIREPFYFYTGDDPEDSLMFLAGIFTIVDPACCDSTFTILTTGAVYPVSILHDRMPVIIRPENIKSWFETESGAEDLKQLMQDSNTIQLNMCPVTPEVNNTRYKYQDCIIPQKS